MRVRRMFNVCLYLLASVFTYNVDAAVFRHNISQHLDVRTTSKPAPNRTDSPRRHGEYPFSLGSSNLRERQQRHVAHTPDATSPNQPNQQRRNVTHTPVNVAQLNVYKRQQRDVIHTHAVTSPNQLDRQRRNLRHAPFNKMSLNLDEGFNICLDPHNTSDGGTSFTRDELPLNRNRHLLERYDLGAMRRFRDDLQNWTNIYRRHHWCGCIPSTQDEVSDFVNIQRPNRTYTNTETEMYVELAEVAFLLGILESNQSTHCPGQSHFNVTGIANKMRNLILLRWFNIQPHFNGMGGSDQDCLITGQVRGQGITSCENLRIFGCLILRRSVAKLNEAIGMARVFVFA